MASASARVGTAEAVAGRTSSTSIARIIPRAAAADKWASGDRRRSTRRAPSRASGSTGHEAPRSHGHPGMPAASVIRVTTDEEIRRRIVDVAAELFAQHGYEGVGVRQVAQEAGVSQYRVRKLTGGRAELFATVMAEKVTSDAADRIAQARSCRGRPGEPCPRWP